MRLYYGVSTADRPLVEKLADSTAGWRSPASTFRYRDTERNKGVPRLIEGLPQQKLDRPIAGLYPGINWYGCYLSTQVTTLATSGKMPHRLVPEAVTFFIKVAKTVAGIRGENDKGLTIIEKKNVVLHERRERWARAHGLAKACKRRDAYTCQICRFCPPAMYHNLSVSGIVEAHNRRQAVTRLRSASSNPWEGPT
jgi:hypothetical protein